MADEGAPNERTVTVPGEADAAAPEAAAPVVDPGSRVETRLWLLAKGADRAEARMCIKFGRRDFRVYVNGELLWSRNYAFTDTQRFNDDSTAKFNEFTALGWDPPR